MGSRLHAFTRANSFEFLFANQCALFWTSIPVSLQSIHFDLLRCVFLSEALRDQGLIPIGWIWALQSFLKKADLLRCHGELSSHDVSFFQSIVVNLAKGILGGQTGVMLSFIPVIPTLWVHLSTFRVATIKVICVHSSAPLLHHWHLGIWARLTSQSLHAGAVRSSLNIENYVPFDFQLWHISILFIL